MRGLLPAAAACAELRGPAPPRLRSLTPPGGFGRQLSNHINNRPGAAGHRRALAARPSSSVTLAGLPFSPTAPPHTSSPQGLLHPSSSSSRGSRRSSRRRWTCGRPHPPRPARHGPHPSRAPPACAARRPAPAPAASTRLRRRAGMSPRAARRCVRHRRRAGKRCRPQCTASPAAAAARTPPQLPRHACSRCSQTVCSHARRSDQRPGRGAARLCASGEGKLCARGWVDRSW